MTIRRATSCRMTSCLSQRSHQATAYLDKSLRTSTHSAHSYDCSATSKPSLTRFVLGSVSMRVFKQQPMEYQWHDQQPKSFCNFSFTVLFYHPQFVLPLKENNLVLGTYVVTAQGQTTRDDPSLYSLQIQSLPLVGTVCPPQRHIQIESFQAASRPITGSLTSNNKFQPEVLIIGYYQLDREFISCPFRLIVNKTTNLVNNRSSVITFVQLSVINAGIYFLQAQ